MGSWSLLQVIIGRTENSTFIFVKQDQLFVSFDIQLSQNKRCLLHTKLLVLKSLLSFF